MGYKIYTRVNLAETSRDPDDIRVENLGCKDNLEQAIDLANKFIKDRFFNKNTQLKKQGHNYTATDFCSWGKTIVVAPINI